MATTAALYASAATSINLTWTNTPNAVGSGTGTYATWVGTTVNAAPVIELSGYGAAAAVPSGSTINSVTITVRHLVSSTTVWPTENAQLYVGTTAKGSLTALTRTTAAHEDTFVVTGLTYADLADLRVRYAPVHSSTATSGTASLDRIGIVVDYTQTTYDLYPARATPTFGSSTARTTGVEFQVNTPCWLTGFLAWLMTTTNTNLFAQLWDDSTGGLVTSAPFPGLPLAANAWVAATPLAPVPLVTGRVYVMSIYFTTGSPSFSDTIPANGPIISPVARNRAFGEGYPGTQAPSISYYQSPIVSTVDPGVIVGSGRRLIQAT